MNNARRKYILLHQIYGVLRTPPLSVYEVSPRPTYSAADQTKEQVGAQVEQSADCGPISHTEERTEDPIADSLHSRQGGWAQNPTPRPQLESNPHT
ncbi:hypothetical protein Tco_0349419 [Tanacetum coccineum]